MKKNRSYKSYVLLFAVFFLASPALSQNNKIIHIEAMGSVAVSENIADADNLALEDAFKRAVAKVAETIIPKGELDALFPLLDDKIYSNASRYILNYRLLSEDIMEDEVSLAEGGVPIYNAYIEADIDVDLLTKDLIGAGIIREGEARTVAVTLLNLRNYKGFELFRSNLAKAAGVKNIRYNSFARDKIELTVETTGVVHALQQEIMAMDMKDWKIEVSVVSGWFSADRIEVRFFPMKGQVNPHTKIFGVGVNQ
ncbi:MAG: hypothetical protein HY266_10880 [Deltaproteobacteria bacterium]|nr:hypothetical protein [Deltaproteobacteria bacterium]